MALVRCSICGKSFDPDKSQVMPFCSLRCKQIDLGRWLDEDYGLAYESEEESASFEKPPQEPED